MKTRIGDIIGCLLVLFLAGGVLMAVVAAFYVGGAQEGFRRLFPYLGTIGAAVGLLAGAKKSGTRGALIGAVVGLVIAALCVLMLVVFFGAGGSGPIPVRPQEP